MALPETEYWSRLQQLFESAAALGPRARADFLETQCDGDPRLRRQLGSLLRTLDCHASTRGQVDTVVDTVVDGAPRAEEVASPVGLAQVGSQLGPYLLVDALGAGGMGAVFLAERADDEYQQRVALKLVQPGGRGQRALLRFREERQILARLEHPNIARLLDGGTEGGLPYLVMEYVPGVSIDQYCQEQELTVEQKIELFCTVCDAVQYAHRNLIVHRDLKPANILVNEEGMPKLLDFGIAKLLESEGEGRASALTVEGFRALTPAYASPEQVLGGTITTASDVYSLGLILYELLTGVRPQQPRSSNPQELLQAICEKRPSKPSTALGRELTIPMRTTASGVSSPRLERRLRGDLDRIVLKALEKEPTHRYPSVDQLAEDLRRHLGGLPVQARPSTWTYRSSRFIRRHRVGVAVAVAIPVMLAAFLLRERELRSAAVAARDQAQREAAKSEAVSGFLEQMLIRANPARSDGEEMTVRALLDDVAVNLARTLEEPEVELDIRRTVGSTYEALGAFAQAEEQYRAGLAVAERELGADSPAALDAKMDVVHVLRGLGKSSEAESLLATIAERLRALDDPGLLARGLQLQGQLALDLRELEKSRVSLLEALSLWQQLPESESWKVRVSTLSDLAGVLRPSGDVTGAEQAHRDALALLERYDDGTNVVRRASIQNNLALLLRDQGEILVALELLRQSLKSTIEIEGENHPRVAIKRVNLGNLLLGVGEPIEGERELRRSLELHRRLYEGDFPGTAIALTHLANALVQLARPKEAVELSRESLAMFERIFGSHHVNVAIAAFTLANGLIHLEQLGEAERYCELALQGFREDLGNEHPWVGGALLRHGVIALERGALDVAERRLAAARGVLDAIRKERVPYAADLAYELGRLAALQGDWVGAESWFRLEIERREHIAPDHYLIARARSWQGLAMAHNGSMDALPILDSGYDLLHARLGADHPLTRDAAERRALGAELSMLSAGDNGAL